MKAEYARTILLGDGGEIFMRQEYLQAGEYIEFLKRSDLGRQYPKEDFQDRIAELVRNVQISLVARNEARQVIGICFGLTDFAYWLLVTDLGVDRKHERMGLGKAQPEHALGGSQAHRPRDQQRPFPADLRRLRGSRSDMALMICSGNEESA